MFNKSVFSFVPNLIQLMSICRIRRFVEIALCLVDLRCITTRTSAVPYLVVRLFSSSKLIMRNSFVSLACEPGEEILA